MLLEEVTFPAVAWANPTEVIKLAIRSSGRERGESGSGERSENEKRETHSLSAMEEIPSLSRPKGVSIKEVGIGHLRLSLVRSLDDTEDVAREFDPPDGWSFRPLSATEAKKALSRRSSIEKRTMMVSNAGESGEYGHQDDRFSRGKFWRSLRCRGEYL